MPLATPAPGGAPRRRPFLRAPLAAAAGLAAGLALLPAALHAAETVIALANPGFESGLDGWTAGRGEATSVELVQPGWRSGNAVRLTDQSPSKGADLWSERTPARAGLGYEARCRVQAPAGNVLGVYLRFYDQDLKPLTGPAARNEVFVPAPATGDDWLLLSCQGVAPADAAWVDIWLHTYSRASGSAVVDELALREFSPSPAPGEPPRFMLGDEAPVLKDHGPLAVDGVAPDRQSLYQKQAEGAFSLVAGPLSPGRYRVTVGAAEFENPAPGSRIVRIAVNARPAVSLDAAALAGFAAAATAESPAVEVGTEGSLRIDIGSDGAPPRIAWVELRDASDRPVARFEAARDLASRAAARATLPAADPGRLAEIASWLSEKPMVFGHVADDRTAWDALARRPEFQAAIAAGERLVDANPPEVSDENFLLVTKTGVRQVNDRESGARAGFLNTLVLAEVLENKGRFLPAIERGLAAILGERTWVMAAHDTRLVNFNGQEIEVDLASSARAWLLALSDQWLGDRLRADTRVRIRAEVRRRVLDPYLGFARKGGAPANGWWWLVGTNNWNAVCNAGVVGAGLALLDSREERALLLANAENSIPFYFRGFEADGYCTEGLGYWNYGYGNYALLAEAVRAATGGRMDFYRLAKAREAALYPGGLQMADGLYPTFADGTTGTRPMAWLLDLLERRLDLGRPCWRQARPDAKDDRLQVVWATAFIDRSGDTTPAAPVPPPRDSFPDSGIFVLRPGRAEAAPFTVALKGGHNAEHHNHNDLGSYVVGVGKATPLVDPGAETYTARTFSKQRYESRILSSYGHPVPLVAGAQQSPGRRFAARVLGHETSPGRDRVALDLRAGYEVPGLLRLRREFTYERDDRRLVVRDEVGFDSPKAFGTALITTGAWRQTAPGTLQVLDGEEGVEVTISSEGAAFAVRAATIEGSLSSKRTATRIGIDLQAPVASGAITVVIRPLAPAARAGTEPRLPAGRRAAADGVVRIEGAAIAAEKNGRVELAAKVGAPRPVLRLWDEAGHELAWDFTLPAAGDYAVRLRYCQGTNGARRRVALAGAPLGGGAGEYALAATGGWSTDGDDWRTAWLAGEDGTIPLARLAAGTGRLVMTAAGGGLNLDWIELVRID